MLWTSSKAVTVFDVVDIAEYHEKVLLGLEGKYDAKLDRIGTWTDSRLDVL